MTTTKIDAKEVKLVHTLEKESVEIPTEILSEAQAFNAVDLILKIRKQYQIIDDRRKERTAPASETIKLINADYKQLLNPLKDAEDKLKVGIEGYANYRITEDLQKQEELRKETKDKGLIIPIGLKSIPSSNGDVRFRKNIVGVITNPAKVPTKYWVIDEKALQADIDATEGNIKIPGVEIKQVATIAIYPA